MTKKSKVEKTVEPWKGVVELWHWQRLSPWIHCYQCLERRNREKGCQLPWVALPGQMEYQQVAFWDNAGKMQTKCAEQSSVPPHLHSLTHLLTVWTVSPCRRYDIYFLDPNLSCLFSLLFSLQSFLKAISVSGYGSFVLACLNCCAFGCL